MRRDINFLKTRYITTISSSIYSTKVIRRQANCFSTSQNLLTLRGLPIPL